MTRGDYGMDSTEDRSSFTPDSGISLCETDFTRSQSDKAHLHTGGRSLLKSLSQDSEYSLYDAEDLLRELGFAGSSDPTIPERFLPSLIERLSKFPETEMRSLNDRILQSIGCFRRKEGKRRLFRNLSTGKETLSGHCLTCPSGNNYPLLRSNTDPAAFPFEDTPTEVSRNALQLNLTNDMLTCHEPEEKLPQSPIAILVSQPSLDLPDSVLDRRASLESWLENDVNGNSDLKFALPSEMSGSPVACPEEKADVGLKKVDASVMKENLDPNIEFRFTQDPNDELRYTQESLRDIPLKDISCEESKVRVDEKILLTALPNDKLFTLNFDISPQGKDMVSTAHETYPNKSDLKDFARKSPLRRASSPQSSESIERFTQSLRHSAHNVSLFLKSNSENLTSDISASNNCAPKVEPLPLHSETLDCNTDTQFPAGETQKLSDLLVEDPEVISANLNSKRNIRNICSDVSLKNPSSNCTKANLSMSQKPVYSRSHSLTNFLTSMLGTDSNLQSTTSSHLNSVLEDVTNETFPSSSSHQGDEIPSCLRTTTSNSTCDRQSHIEIKELPLKESPATANSMPTATEIPKTINRKRRMLRRMSSSLHSFEEDGACNYKSDPIIHIHSIKDFDSFSSDLPSCEMQHSKPPVLQCVESLHCCTDQIQPHMPVFKSHSCINFSSGINHSLGNRKNENIYHQKCLRHVSQSSVKPKKNSRRKRILSCPFPKAHFNFSPWVSCCDNLPDVYLPNVRIFKSKSDTEYMLAQHLCDSTDEKCVHSPLCVTDRKSWKFDYPKVNNQRISSSTPFVLSPVSTNDFFPSRTSSGKSKACMWYSRPHQQLEAAEPEVNLDLLSEVQHDGNKKVLSRLHREENFSDSSNSIFEDCYLQDEVFHPQQSDRAFQENLLSSYQPKQENLEGFVSETWQTKWDRVTVPDYNVHSSDPRLFKNVPFCSEEQKLSNQNGIFERHSLVSNQHTANEINGSVLDNQKFNSESNYRFPSISPKEHGYLDQSSKQSGSQFAPEYKNSKPLFVDGRTNCTSDHASMPLSATEADSEVLLQNRGLDHCCCKRTSKKNETVQDGRWIDCTSDKFLSSSLTGLSGDFMCQIGRPTSDLKPTAERSSSLPAVSSRLEKMVSAVQIRPFSQTHISHNKTGQALLKSISIDGNSSEPKSQSPSSSNKREEMLEKKIRIFTKFLASLGNLSKVVSNAQTDSARANASEISLSCGPLKPTDKNHGRRTEAPSCVTPPAEIERLLYLLKTIDLKKTLPEDSNKGRACLNTVIPTLYGTEVSLDVNRDPIEGQWSAVPVQYSSYVLMDVNSPEDDDRQGKIFPTLSEKKTRELENSSPTMSQMPFQEVSKDLVELQASIQKAKQTRISASRELHFLQELLSGESLREKDDGGSGGRNSSKSKPHRERLKDAKHLTRALSDLRQKSKRDVLEDTEFWQEEMRKMKEENDRIWHERLDRMEEKLKNQEEALAQLQAENDNLRNLGTTTVDGKVDILHKNHTELDTTHEENEKLANYKPSTPTPSTRQDCERLQAQLLKAEQRGDELNLLLNQKLIELNKLQLTLSKQTKEMVELEKSYIQLQCRFRRSSSKPVVSRLCSRTSPFSSKNLFPKPSPPASPAPTGICP